jgi:hypothetical protein
MSPNTFDFYWAGSNLIPDQYQIKGITDGIGAHAFD